MISLLSSLSWKSRTLLAVLIVCLLSAATQAETITIKNTTNGTIVIETTYQAGTKVAQGPPITLKAGETSPGITLPGNKRFRFFDVNMPNTPLGQQVVPGGKNDLDFVIVPSTKPPWKVLLQPAPMKDKDP
jgi:hypothetical protein